MIQMRNILRNIIGLTFVGLLVIMHSCEKHDFFDEKTITGKVGPQAYWELSSSTINAGDEVPFTVQYYTTSAPVTHSEVWYNIMEKEERKVSCPWVTSFTYEYNSFVSNEVRLEQRIKNFPHSNAVWSDTLRAFTLSGTFPTSNTLPVFEWVKPTHFDSTMMDKYFGVGYMQHFKDSLFNLMTFPDFKNMLLGLDLLEDFKQFTDSTQDPNAGINVWVYHFPKDAAGNTPVPAEVKTLYDGIPFDKLISDANGHAVEYKRRYQLNAKMRVYDTNETYATTVSKEIEIN